MRRPLLRLLLVEDDILEARLLKANLDRPEHVRVEVVHSGAAALDRLGSGPLDAVVTDLSMPEMDGIELVRRIRAFDPTLPVLIVTAHGTLARAVEAIRAGATEFLPKPVNAETVLALVERALTERPIREEAARRRRRGEPSAADYFVGADSRLDAARLFATRVARVPGARVVITGETGTGKSALARAIHDLSDSRGAFVAVNCGAIPSTLLESELFGHEAGAFTDARSMKKGLIETAERGTLLLDEISALPLELQAKLLLFLESQEIRRIGGTRPIPVSCRVIAATNEDLQARISEGSFRRDLFYRLDVASIEMPPLRKMPGLIPELAEHLLRRIAHELGRPAPELDDQSLSSLVTYSWPGNARELRNTLERALIFHEKGPLRAVPPHPHGDASANGVTPSPAADAWTFEPDLSLEDVERRYIGLTLEQHGDRSFDEIADTLGISRKTLWDKRRRFGL